jgi:hypothetical protein
MLARVPEYFFFFLIGWGNIIALDLGEWRK